MDYHYPFYELSHWFCESSVFVYIISTEILGRISHDP